MAITNTTLNTLGNVILSSSGTSVVTSMYFCNKDSSARTFNLFLVPSGGTADDTTIVYKNVTVAAGDTYVVDMEKIILDSGEAISANVSANAAIVATVSHLGV